MGEGGNDWGRLYAACIVDIEAVAAGLTDDQLGARVPATPDWTARMLLAHLAGTSADFVAGRMDGAPSPVWTARHVAEREGRPVADLVEELRATQAAVIEQTRGNDRPALVWDKSVHLADLQEGLGLGRPDEGRWRPVLDAVTGWKLAEIGPVPVDDYELFRGFFSRRSMAQMRAWGTGLDDETLAGLCIFGPREDDQPVAG